MPTRTLSLLDFAEDYADHNTAIEAAAEQGWTLNAHADPLNGAAQDVPPEYAKQAAYEDPALVYLTRVLVLPDTSHTPTAAQALERLFSLSHYTAPEVIDHYTEAARDALRDVVNEATPDDEDDTDYRRLCKEAGISPA